MTDHSLARRSAIIYITIAVLAFSITAIGRGQTHEDSLRIFRKQEALIDRQISNQEAQTIYYRKQADSLGKRTEKTFQKSIEENPTAIGAFIAAMVALISFAMNYRATIRNQTDTQFYEALKRFGDKESPAARASASGLLAQMGRVEFLTFQREFPFIRKARPYSETAMNQLIAGISIETEGTILDSTATAVQDLMRGDPSTTIRQLYTQNRELQKDLLYAISQVYAINGEGIADRISPELASVTAMIAGYEQHVLDVLIKRHPTIQITALASSLYQNSHRNQEETLGKYNEHVYNSLRTTSHRLRANVSVLSFALRRLNLVYVHIPKDRFHRRIGLSAVKIRTKSFPLSIDFSEAFLVRANLSSTHLRGIDFTNAQLQNVFFISAQLDSADLTGSYLEGADMTKASLTHSILDEAYISGTCMLDADLNNSPWWKANFTNKAGIDESLLQEIYTKYTNIPSDPSEVHQSLRDRLYR